MVETINDAQQRLQKQYSLSRQTALMLALLVLNPQVSSTTIRARFGGTNQYNLMSRLRTRLQRADAEVTINTLGGFGYYMNAETRNKLKDQPDESAVLHDRGQPIRGEGEVVEFRSD